MNKKKTTLSRFVENTNSIRSFLNDIRKYKILSPEEEKNLFFRYKSCDSKEKKDIEETVLMSNQRIIYSKALCFTQNPDIVLDYVKEGNFGLLRAMSKFDLNMGVRFITFAIDYIYAAMQEYHLQYGNIVRRSNFRKVGLRLKDVCDNFYSEHQREATQEEIKEIFFEKYGVEIKDNSDMFDIVSVPIVNMNGDEEDEEYTESSEFSKITASYNDYIDTEENEYKKYIVTNLLDKLDERSRNIIKMAYGIDREYPVGLDTIAKKFNITRIRVNQIIADSLKTMRR